MKPKYILLLFILTAFQNGIFSQVKPLPREGFPGVEQQLDDEDEGEGAIKYWNELEEKILEMNRRNGVTSRNRAGFRYNASKQLAKGTSISATTNGNWTQVYQAQSAVGMGRIECVAFHPTDPNTFYIGTAGGGLFKTTNNGLGYQPLTDGLATGGVSSIVVDPLNANVVYIATGFGFGGQSATSIGVLKSTDAGFTFSETGLTDTIGGTDPLVIYELKMDPTSHTTLYAATNRGLYKTSNSGASWSIVLTGFIPGFPAIFDVDFKPGSQDVVFATYYDRVYHSNNSGDAGTWAFTFLPAVPTYFTYWFASRIAVSAANPNGFYLAAAVQSSNDSVRAADGDVFLINCTYNSVNNTATLSTPKKVKGCSQVCIRSGGGRLNGDIYVSQSNVNNIIVGGLEIFATSNAGVSWVTKSVTCAGARNFHVDIASINYNNGQLYVTVDGGIYRQVNEDYTSSTTAWTDITAGLEITQLYTHDGSPQDDQYYLYANQDNSVHLRTGLVNYTSIVGGDGTACKFDKTDKLIYYGCVQNGEYMYRFDHGVNAYITPGANSDDLDTAQYSGSFNFAKVFMIDENVNTTLYAAKRNFYKSTNKGTNWVRKDVPGATTPQNIMRVAKANSSTIYMFQDNGTFRRSINGGDVWDNLTANLPANVYLSDIGIDPDASTWVYITCYGNVADKKVFRSTTGGNSFPTNLSQGLPNVDIRCINVVGGLINEVYVGTDVGVFYRNDIIGHWINFSNGLPVTQINSIYINPGYQTISVGTFGRGIWVSPVYGSAACPVNITLNNTYVYRNVFSASGTITSTGTILGDVNSNIKFSGGTNVIMSPGFIAQANSNFRAVIEGCAPQPEILKTKIDSTKSKDTRVLENKDKPVKSGGSNSGELQSGGSQNLEKKVLNKKEEKIIDEEASALKKE